MFTPKLHPLVVFVIVCLTLCVPLTVKADAAPPQAPPGSTITTGHFVTHVQMVSEEVTIDVQTYHGPTMYLYEEEYFQDETHPNALLIEGSLFGHVTASFMMQNQGDEPESFEVWFPIGASDGGYNGAMTVANFQTWVNGSLVETGRRETKQEHSYLMIPWATWPVDFPVGEQVQLTVSYDLPPTSVDRQHRFGYILETGAGWWGTIERGTFIFRLPYEVTEENASLEAGYDSLPIKYVPLENVTLSGNEMRWEFSNLEPEPEDNLQLRILPPSVWEGILSARAGADANPNSVEAQLRLAHALADAIAFSRGLVVSGQQFVPQAVQAYEDALELAPDDIEIYVDYIGFLNQNAGVNGPIPTQLEPTLRRALEIAPDDERLLAWEEDFQELQQIFVEKVERQATIDVTRTAGPLQTLTAQAQETPTPTLTLTRTSPASTPTLAATTDAPPPPLQQSGGFPAWVVIAGSVVLLFALAIVLRRQAGYDESGPGL